MKQECAQTKRQSPDQDQHGPRGRAILPGQAERAFPGRPGPAQTESRALFPRQTGTSTDRVAAHLSQNGMSHPLGPFRGNASGMGAFGGPFSSRGRGAGFLAISGPKPVGTWQTRTSKDQDQHGPRGRALFPRKAGRAGFLAISGPKPVGTMADQDQHRPGPARTVGQSPLSQADQDQRLNVDRSHHTRGVRTP